MSNNIWLMEGLSSQRNIIQGINVFSNTHQANIIIYASHHNERNEILSVASHAIIEPKDSEKRLQFIMDTVNKFGINVLHISRNSLWFEDNRAAIEACGVTLTTGAASSHWLTLAEDKFNFAQFMEQNNLSVVPSWRIDSLSALQAYLDTPPFSDSPVCVKPVTGIYGMGFWRFDDTVSPADLFNHPEKRIVNTQQYFAAASCSAHFTPLVLMPYLPGPECSVDILADKGEILAAVGRRKDGAIQYLENEGEAFELACACARAMNADGLVNVQTRNDHNGKPVLLETNLRPSGGIGYTLHSGVNLPGLFAAYKLGLMSKNDVIGNAKSSFSPLAVRTVTEAIVYPEQLTNRLN